MQILHVKSTKSQKSKLLLLKLRVEHLFSTHTIRDLLFYCEKEKLDLFLFCIDYTKAFDFLEYGYIHKVFKLYNFKENFCSWIKILFNGRKSCISNNGFISEKFNIKRSTMQGDPLSPLVFILALELLFIAVRSDENIRGVKVEGQEIKLSAYADDSSYMVRDESSGINLLSTIGAFSKIFGIQVNRSKSECLIMKFESQTASYEDKFLGIPVVETVKILGHYFGRNKIICDFQNFYSKLNKMEKIMNIWKQRDLTLLGKNVIVSSLINSQVIFNAQIETPPPHFLKIIESLKKNFLWGGGTPKIAHKGLIGSIEQGGINYKDLDIQIKSLNTKFILNLMECKSNRKCLPLLWIRTLFEKSINLKLEELDYFRRITQNGFSIVTQCSFNLPRKNKWKGHPFYFECLQTIQSVNTELPKSIHE